MPPHFRRHVLRQKAPQGNEYPLLVDRIFAGWYEPACDGVQIVSAAPASPVMRHEPMASTVDRIPENPWNESALEPSFHVGDSLPGEVEELKRLGVSEERIAEMWGRFSPERIAKILGVTVSQVRIVAAWSRRAPAVASVRADVPLQGASVLCAQCEKLHLSYLQTLDERPVCSEICQIEWNARLESERASHSGLAPNTTIISGTLNADTIRELLIPAQNRLPREVAAPSRSV